MFQVEFRFWGLQTRAERWIHSHALRNTMLRAHKQAWVWQDEWHDLTLEDVRELERDVIIFLSILILYYNSYISVVYLRIN